MVQIPHLRSSIACCSARGMTTFMDLSPPLSFRIQRSVKQSEMLHRWSGTHKLTSTPAATLPAANRRKMTSQLPKKTTSSGLQVAVPINFQCKLRPIGIGVLFQQLDHFKKRRLAGLHGFQGKRPPPIFRQKQRAQTQPPAPFSAGNRRRLGSS